MTNLEKKIQPSNKLKSILLCFGILQFILSINHLGTDNWNIHSKPVIDKYKLVIQSLSDEAKTFSMNPDEESNYEIAVNSINGLGYTKLDAVTERYENASWNSPQTVFLYKALIAIGIDFDVYIFAYLLTASIFHYISLITIYKILVNQGSKWALLGVFSWALFPSAVYYINTLFLYESLTTSLLLLFVYNLSLAQRSGELHIRQYFFITLLALTMTFFRYHTAVLVLLVFFVFFINNGRLERLKILLLSASVLALIFVTYVPALLKNKTDFGRPVVSTQLGFELWQGSNPMARGSFDGSGRVFDHGLKNMPNVAVASQLEKSDYLKSKAIAWAVSNPDDYLMLTFRKIAIYFLPQNFELLPGSRVLNPINALVYLLFFISILIFFRISRIEKWLIIAPVMGSVALTLITFVGYRWRFYAEPFMVIMGVWGLKYLVTHCWNDRRRGKPLF